MTDFRSLVRIAHFKGQPCCLNHKWNHNSVGHAKWLMRCNKSREGNNCGFGILMSLWIWGSRSFFVLPAMHIQLLDRVGIAKQITAIQLCWLTTMPISLYKDDIFNTILPERNGRRFQVVFSIAFSWTQKIAFGLNYHKRTCLLKGPKHDKSALVRQWLSIEQATSQYLYQSWPSCMAHMASLCNSEYTHLILLWTIWCGILLLPTFKIRTCIKHS